MISEINTTMISNSTLRASYNDCWNNADRDGNTTLDFNEFQNMVNKSIAWAFRLLATEGNCRDIYNQISDGVPITKEKLNEYIKDQTGLDVVLKSDEPMRKVINEHNNNVKAQQKAEQAQQKAEKVQQETQPSKKGGVLANTNLDYYDWGASFN